jgi:isopentenyldiphosphate isomerase
MNEETFYIVDQTDRVIGTATRGQVHGNPELIHRVAHVLVFNDQGDLFLQKRSLQKDVQPGKWDTSVGGHVNLGESYLEAAAREMKEELGIEPGEIEFLYKYRHSNDFEAEFVTTFRCTWNGEFTINRDELSEGRFWRLEEILTQAEATVFSPNFLDELQRYTNFMMDNQESKN